MKSILTFIAVLSLSSIIMSCGNSNSPQNNEDTKSTTQVSVNDTSANSDTVATQPKVVVRDTLPKNCTAQQAINHMKNSGHWDKYSAGILPSIVEQHLPYAQRLINNTHDYFIIVDKGAMMVILYDKYGRQKLSYKMACGKNYGHKQKKADSRTPEGYFLCGGVFNSTDWLYTNDWGVTSPARGQFGPRFIRVCPQIGIHGTAARYSIGRRCSHGCIRIQNENIMELHTYAEKGMPIIVNPGPNDDKVNKKNGINKPMLRIPNLPAVEAQAMEAEKAVAQKRSEEAKAKKDSVSTKPTSTKTDTTKSAGTDNNAQPKTEDTPQVEEAPAAEKPSTSVAEPKTEPKVEPKEQPKEQPKAEPAQPATAPTE